MTAHVVVFHLGHQLRLERLPFRRTLRAPAARASGRVAGESGRLHELLELRNERATIVRRDPRRESDVVEESRLVVEAEQERPDDLPRGRVAESTDDAVGGAPLLDLLHA